MAFIFSDMTVSPTRRVFWQFNDATTKDVEKLRPGLYSEPNKLSKRCQRRIHFTADVIIRLITFANERETVAHEQTFPIDIRQLKIGGFEVSDAFDRSLIRLFAVVWKLDDSRREQIAPGIYSETKCHQHYISAHSWSIY